MLEKVMTQEYFVNFMDSRLHRFHVYDFPTLAELREYSSVILPLQREH